ncbi:hypothetical protein DFR24_1229 [Panacagrimonas perspica]|uniref:Uncharacterized protein n=1 Tax=Panacagrimonas perspica TaxID=381431 RepID=A0A4V3F697_9GAMM|nr:hypothetical protein [Panacagrimonas perspica]TDU31846.1 hypothetical protein DFR24_1229 [Panacagrimonas perspica]THD02950.1 hypothetical protein B1810_10095 [Panacagrimonas perspica]
MFDLQTFTLIHVLISIAAFVTGIPLLMAFARGNARPSLATATIVLLVLTSATGFAFPFTKILPSHVFGVLSLAVLAVTYWARWKASLAGGWRKAYIVTLAVAIYLDAFVFVVQAFLKVPALTAIAPTQQSPGFAIAQGVLLVIFVGLGYAGLRGLGRAAPAVAVVR